VIIPEPAPKQPETKVIPEVLPTKEEPRSDDIARVEEVKTLDAREEPAD
jgi:hypothetical protein